MENNEHILVIECPHCGNRTEHTIFDIIDSEENEYEKQRLLSDNIFEYHCPNCDKKMDLCYNLIYRDVKRNMLIYLVHENDVDGVCTAFSLSDNLEAKYNPDATRPVKRIVTCPHSLREKVLILENDLDDRLIELAKIFCAQGVYEAVPGFDPIGAVFNVKNGEFVIELVGEDRTLTSPFPEGFYEHLEEEFADVLESDNPYIVDKFWALDVLGIDPYDEMDCDGDCENCPKNCGDDYDDCDSECDECERDCDNCDCRKCEMVFGDDDDFECDGNCEECHGCDEDDSESDGGWYEEDDEWDEADNADEDDREE